MNAENKEKWKNLYLTSSLPTITLKHLKMDKAL